MNITLLIRFFLSGIFVSLLLFNCSSSPTEDDPANDEQPVFSSTLIKLNDIDYIEPLGALGPPSHTFPTDHMYFYIRPAENSNITVNTAVFSPGNLTLVEANAYQHVNAGFTDFAITLKQGNIYLQLGHLSSLSEHFFGNTTDLSGWNLHEEYTTGGETYRSYSKLFNLAIQAGDSLGTAGSNPGQYALDVAVYALDSLNGVPANPSRWTESRYLNALCPLSFYAPGALLDSLLSLVNRNGGPQDKHACGQIMQDISGTAQGCWFFQGIANTYPEDNHLALVWDHRQPSMAAISAGVNIASLPSGLYEFIPQNSGRLNRTFAQVSADGLIYGYTPNILASGVIIISLPAESRLRIEYLPSATSDPDTWHFTENVSEFVR